MKNLLILATMLLTFGFANAQSIASIDYGIMTTDNVSDTLIKSSEYSNGKCCCVQVLYKGKYYYHSQSNKSVTCYEWRQQVKRMYPDVSDTSIRSVAGNCPSRCNCETPPEYGSCKD
jgi:hypothetical protein